VTRLSGLPAGRLFARLRLAARPGFSGGPHFARLRLAARFACCGLARWLPVGEEPTSRRFARRHGRGLPSLAYASLRASLARAARRLRRLAPRILSTLLLLGGAIAWLLGPGAPAQPRGAGVAVGEPAEEEPWTEGVWREGPAQDPDEPEPRSAAAEPSEPAPAEEPVLEPAPADADASLDLVRRMLAVLARMGEP